MRHQNPEELAQVVLQSRSGCRTPAGVLRAEPQSRVGLSPARAAALVFASLTLSAVSLCYAADADTQPADSTAGSDSTAPADANPAGAPPAAANAAPASGTGDAVAELAQQARYWESKNRYEMGAESWRKLLRLSPNNSDALAALALDEARSGQAGQASSDLDQLRATDPRQAQIPAIEDAIHQGAFNDSSLEPARGLAKQGKYDDAVDAYRKIYGKNIPGGTLGLEYYQTLAGSQNGWEPARSGLEQLAKSHPNDPRYQLALAQHYTYRESTRREGLDRLEALSSSPMVAEDARRSWREALGWLGTSPGDERYYRDYVNRYGNDPELSAKLNKTRSNVAAANPVRGAVPVVTIDATTQATRDAYHLLNEGKTEAADSAFQAILDTHPNDAEAVAGVGICRLRQQRFSEARAALERAVQLAPSEAPRWREAISSARFWELVREGEAARKAGDLGLAEHQYREALEDSAQAEHNPSVRASLGDILADEGHFAEAEVIYRENLRRNPQDVDSTRGLMSVLSRNGHLEEALAVAERLPPGVRDQLGNYNILKAQALRDHASRLVEGGNDTQAEVELRQALVLDPESPYTRMDLARLYERHHRNTEADTLIDGLLATDPTLPDALFVKAQLQSNHGDTYGALQTLEQIPEGSRTADMFQLQKRLWVHYQLQRASVYPRLGRSEEAAQILAQVEPLVGDDPQLLGEVANAYADVGDNDRALHYIRQALTRQPNPSPGLRLVYASLLLKLRQDAEFEVVMVDLSHRTGLNAEEVQNLNSLNIGYRVRQSDMSRDRGDLARAYEYLRPLLMQRPVDPRAQMGLARLYGDSKEYDHSLGIYQQIIANDPNNVDAYKGAADASLALGNNDDAQAYTDRAAALQPGDSSIYALQGRVARAKGDNGKAIELFQQALRAQSGGYGSGAPAGGSGGGGGTYLPELQLLEPHAAGAAQQQSRADRTLPAPAARHRLPALARAHPQARPQPWFVVLKQGTPADSSRRPSFGLQAAVWHEGRGHRVSPARGHLWRVADYVLPAGSVIVPNGNAGYWQQNPDGTYAYLPRRLPVPVGGDQPYTPAAPAPRHRRHRHTQASATTSAPMNPAVPAVASPAPLAPPPEQSSVILTAPQPIAPAMPMPVTNTAPVSPAQAQLCSDAAALCGALKLSPQLNATPARPRRRHRHYAAVLQSGVSAPALTTTPQLSLLSGPSSDPAFRYPALAAAAQGAAPPAPAYGPPPPHPLMPAPVLLGQGDDLTAQINDIKAEQSGDAAIGLMGRTRDGRDGVDKLTDIEMPLEAMMPLGDWGRAGLRVVPVYLNPGTLAGNNQLVFGTLPLVNKNILSSLQFDQSISGASVEGVYENENLQVDIGSSPLGFHFTNVIGGLRYSQALGPIGLSIDLTRRTVTDSLLSYAGARDPGLNEFWGAVTKSGGRLDASYDFGGSGLYVNGGYYALRGHSVENNHDFELGAGFYVKAIQRPNLEVTWGLNLTTFFYSRDLSYYTFGQGGYFSPQRYYNVGIPASVSGSRGRFSYKVNGALGMQVFHENGSPAFPLGLPFTPSGTQVIPADYPSRSVSGVAFSIAGAAEYLIDHRLSIGGELAFNNASDYNEFVALGYARYSFWPQSRVQSPPQLLQPYFNYGNPAQK